MDWSNAALLLLALIFAYPGFVYRYFWRKPGL